MRVGLDFDNTIAGYDELFAALAIERGVLAAPGGGKQAVKSALHAQGEAGERAWTQLQAMAYGPRMIQAVPTPGCRDFLEACRDANVELCVVSHKSRRAAGDPCVDLHRAARAWMTAHGIFEIVPPERVFFEATREDKVRRIAALQPSHFIDDLAEVFEHPLFPAAVQPILFDPHGEATATCRPVACSNWVAIRERVLGH